MEFKKIAHRLAGAALAGTLMVSMLGMTAFAEDTPSEVKNVTITKELTKEVNVYAPNTTFTFTIVPGTAVDAGEGQDKIYPGEPNGAYFAENAGTIASAPTTEDIGKGTITVGTTDISIDSTKFTKPGIYRYVVKETAGSYEGIAYSTEEKYFDVYVDKDLNVYAYTFVDSTNGKAKDDGVFTNDYGTAPGNDTLHDLTVKKMVTGNQGDKGQEFEFTIKVDSTVNGEQYYVVFSDGTTPITLTSGTANTIKLSDGETATIYGLSASDVYTVTETDYSSDGYTTTIGNIETNEATGTIAADTTVEVVNNRETTTPTGLILNITPYILMVALAGVLAFLFVRRRRTEF